MTAICYSSPISAVSRNVQLLGEKRTCAKFSKTERLVHVYTDEHVDTPSVTLIFIYNIYLIKGLLSFLLGVQVIIVKIETVT